MRRRLLALLIGLGLAHGAIAGPVARVETGRLEGISQGGADAFLGTPYAAPPTGERRWRPPVAAKAWRGVRRADAYAPACPQAGVSMPGEPPPRTDEDCLYLNVWRPATRSDEPLPVVVWIHGGGWTNGATSLPLYAGDRLAARGVVFVSIAYRLGALGFLAHPALSAEGGGQSGDYGLMDQVAALRWVQRNIAAFGGDPGRVTIAGQSAGAMSVSALMASPQAAGLFHRAIAQSGGLFEPLELAPNYRLAGAEKDGAAWAADEGARTASELRALPLERLLTPAARRLAHPAVGTRVLPLSPYEAYVAGRWNRVPLLLGYNAEEARSLVDLAPVTARSFAADITRDWGPLPPALLAGYPFSDDAGARRARADFERDLRFSWDMWAWARLQAGAGQPVWLYRFSRRPPFPADSVRADWGAGHFAELWYMFDHLEQEPWAWTAQDRALADVMVGAWVAFAREGRPGEHWPAYRLDESSLLDMGEVAAPGPVPELPGLRVFDAVYDAVRGRPFGAPPTARAGSAGPSRPGRRD